MSGSNVFFFGFLFRWHCYAIPICIAWEPTKKLKIECFFFRMPVKTWTYFYKS
ncbi:hypothetical protein M6B38_254030 [Iris pallida]|uniref:Uncharacterized protein n=1 Tax=Iris pallida TaxID=29817 RepID=A0AAX6IJY8_IRIPA|nr:hypothetical protein M6B38_254030 [Iris pallida]